MGVKKCSVETCQSCSTRAEDVGVTYHKLPKHPKLCDIWISVTRLTQSTDQPAYVCSRHFCKNDFQNYKDSKYVLKSDAVPSIFPWNLIKIIEKTEMEVDKITVSDDAAKDTDINELNSSKESEPENLDAIRKFLADNANSGDSENKPDNSTLEEKPDEINIKGPETSKSNKEEATQLTAETKELNSAEKESKIEKWNIDEVINVEMEDEKVAVASSVMNMILSDSEAQIAKKEDSKCSPKQAIATGEKGNSMSLSVGTKVQAKDFGEYWHPAQIVEVDYDEMEVLVHYENAPKRHDEWISVSSPRLRPMTSHPPTPILIPDNTPEATQDATLSTPASEDSPAVKEEPKHEEKPKIAFVVGERCLARWRDNRRFIATVNQVLDNGKYEVIFDDGVRWTCSITRLSKLKEPSWRDSLSIDTSCSPSSLSTTTPAFGPSHKLPGETIQPLPPFPAFHTHLFDPTRDYLGSKSERRAMKRKLNIKEIFNIGLKKKKEDAPREKPKKIVKQNPKIKKEKIKKEPLEKTQVKMEVKNEIRKELPDAVASIIGTVAKGETKPEPKTEVKDEIINTEVKTEKTEVADNMNFSSSETISIPESVDIKPEDDSAQEEEAMLEKLEPAEDNHAEVIGKMKEVINKLEDGLIQAEAKAERLNSPKLEVKDEIVSPKPEVMTEIDTKVNVSESIAQTTSAEVKDDKDGEKSKKSPSKIKKSKKMRLLQEKKVKKQVQKVKNELEEMKRQMEEMRKQMFEKTEELSKRKGAEMPESFLLPGEWCCKWVNGQPVGKVSEVECEVKVDGQTKSLLRRSVEVEDKRLPPGWTKHMVRRSIGHSAGKWDIVLMSPETRKFHTKTDMRNYLEQHPEEMANLKDYEDAILDFGIHIKLSRRMGWYSTTPDDEPQSLLPPLPAGTLATTSPLLVKNKNLSLKRKGAKIPGLDNKSRKDKKHLSLKAKMKKRSLKKRPSSSILAAALTQGTDAPLPPIDVPPEQPPLEDGFVYVGSLKVQIIENLLRCPAEGCFKNFRNNTLLKMHIKHYHRELRKMLGATPKVLDLAFARTRPNAAAEMTRLKLEAVQKTIKIKLPRLPKKFTDPKRLSETNIDVKELNQEPFTVSRSELAVQPDIAKVPRSLDSPKIRAALSNKSVKRPKVLLPVRRPDVPDKAPETTVDEEIDFEDRIEPKIEVPDMETLDFETAISTHTVTKPMFELKRKGDKKKKTFASISKKFGSEDEEWYGLNNSDVETRSSYPRSGTPDSKADLKLVSSESNEDQKDSNVYMYTESGERIKIVHMKREEIINCHCGFREEDGLMVQCELCLCWQHALCHNIQREADVPEKYTCSICLNPRRGRRSQRFLHDQDRLYEGLLPGAKPCDALRRSHELSGNLIRIDDALHALRVKYHVATKKDHPKLYLWAKDWENSEASFLQEKLNSDYSDLNIMIGDIGKENLPMKAEEMKDLPMEIKTPPSSEQEIFSMKNQLGSQSLLSGLLSSPSGASLDLPISAAELERLANAVQEQEAQRLVVAPVPEAPIENSACREHLLRHIQRCQALIDARLDSIEAQVAELESQDPSFEDDETADFFPRTKQTIQMLMRDLDTMEELGVVT